MRVIIDDDCWYSVPGHITCHKKGRCKTVFKLYREAIYHQNQLSLGNRVLVRHIVSPTMH